MATKRALLLSIFISSILLSSCVPEELQDQLESPVITEETPAEPIIPETPEIPSEPDIPVVVVPNSDSRIVIISDLNGSYGSLKYDSRINKAIDRIITIKPDLVLVTGDMVAGQKSGLNYKGMWQAFEAVVTIPLSNHGIPVFVTPGNHDASAYSGFAGERKIYKDIWQKYQENFLNSSGVELLSMNNYPFYYSFKSNNTLFVSLDATTTNQITGDQRAWLLEQVKNEKEVAHKVLFSHMPMSPVAQGRENDYIRDPNNELFNLLKAQKVDLFLSGHHHAYYPAVFNDIRLVSQSCLGSGPRKLIGGSSVSQYSFTMVDLNEHILVDAYKYPDYRTPVNRSSLVKQIKSPKGGYLTRDDIVLKDHFSIGDI